ncbi:glycosyltransferase [Tuanshanicoccus lijuaniae]|uniref:glycosyltransferase n=1 Tax=Aerococcaceae bacterium zg-1292 TaxID=2774330 RepID=UPI001BD8EDD8|nr:glycosyltransferase [Aerococcaceae bacterium zg-A91]MBS4458444.1 glycosyltransferase [Aerococcaceae bacterium zg-BR33]
MKNNVAVLLSHYNGAKYLVEQIESVLSQKDVNVTLFIRDDGSSDDNSKEILESFRDHCEIFFESNVGVGKSFMELVSMVGNSFDYYAFCDQDDVWLEDKLICAIQYINDDKEPVLYNSNQMLVDSKLNKIGLRHDIAIDSNFLAILNNNKLTGCTMVWNKPLQHILLKSAGNISNELLKVRIHDVYVAMIASVLGRIKYDKNAYILYRQHDNNVVGVKKTPLLKQWQQKLENKEMRQGRSKLAQEILYYYEEDINEQYMLDKLNKAARYTKDIKSKLALMLDSDIQKYANENQLMYFLKVFLEVF